MARAKSTTSSTNNKGAATGRKPRAAEAAPERQPVAAPAAPAAPARQAGSGRRPAAKAPAPTSPEPAASPVLAVAREAGGKQAAIVAALRRPEGATVAELMQRTGWMSHSVRGALSGALKRKLGLTIDSRVEPDRGRVYRIVEAAQPKTAESAAAETGAVAAPAPAKARRSKQRAGASPAGRSSPRMAAA